MYVSTASLVAGALLAQTALARPWSPPKAKNVIFVVPDGHGQAHQTLVRTYLSQLNNGATTRNPAITPLTVDDAVRCLFPETH